MGYKPKMDFYFPLVPKWKPMLENSNPKLRPPINREEEVASNSLNQRITWKISNCDWHLEDPWYQMTHPIIYYVHSLAKYYPVDLVYPGIYFPDNLLQVRLE